MDAKNMNGSAPKQEKKEFPKYESPLQKTVPNFFSRFLFCWMIPIYYNGTKRDLEEYDLVPAKRQYDSKRVGDVLERYWLNEEAAAKAAGKKPSLLKTFAKAFGLSFISAGIMQFLCVGIRTFTPLLFAQLLQYWSVGSTMSKETAAMYAGGMILANWASALLNHHGNLAAQQFGMKLRISASSLMFRKIMRMNNSSLGDTTAGKVVNILSNDMQRFDLALLFLHYIWIIPIQLAVVCYLGYLQAGYAALVGLASLVIIALPIQGYVGQKTGKVRFRTAEKTDERIKVMSEVISGIQVIKMYAWEIPFQKVVSEKRANELKEIRVASYLRIVFLGFMLFTERSALFITILVFILFGNTMSANVIYPLQQFMSAAQINITLVLPLVLAFTAELFVTIGRIQDFLQAEDRPDLAKNPQSAAPMQNLFNKLSAEGALEKGDDHVRPLSYQRKSEAKITETPPVNVKPRKSVSLPGDIAVELRNVSASWTNDPTMSALSNVSLRLRRGKLCAVIGAVGSGKSSILQMLLKELPPYSGTVSVNGTVSYASQEAWLFPSTVRENILFGLAFDPEKYKRVCRACCLEKDFKQFPYGDQTLVGERGVSLSGGQRARINLARSVYRESDIYLLDDPLSAVDANVGRLLFEGCINGYLRGRTRILVTHQIHFLKAADYIVVLNEGQVENMGTFDELVESGKEFATLLASLQEGKDKDADSVGSGVSIEDKEKRDFKRMISSASTNENDDIEEFKAQTQEAEERQSGNLKWSVVSAYFSSGGNICFIAFTVTMILLAAVAAGATDYWISFWSNNMARYEESLEGGVPESGLDVQVGLFTTGQYLIIHGCLVITLVLLTHLRIFPFVALIVNASKNLHDFMFSTMIKGIMRFFDTSSSGRILNRFTKDMGALDEILPRTLLDVVQIYSTLLVILILNAIALYWTLIPSFVLLICFMFMVRIYMKTAQSIKRLEGITKSPVFGMVTSSLNGIATIRSAGAEKRLIDDFDNHQDLHTASWNGYLCGGSSFGLYLDTVCLIYLTTVIFIFIYIDFGDLIAVGSVGIAVTQTNALTAMLQHGARMLVEFIAQLTSVERVLDYTRIETESNLFEGQIESIPTWPSEGRIVFDNVNMRYSPTEEPVLKDLNITVESGWKVGIVGRTGAGKSSLISALFRFAYLDGKVTIDGVDTSLVAKQELRSKISIIPQEPVLFSATIRYNLDPFNLYSDAQLWQALEQVDMKSAVPSLDFKVTEGGSNFSVGQRQLMCLARAVLRSNKILIMDEATANVDPQTDNYIQQTIKEHFASCTVLTIAHRLNTIMESDRVLVMSFGRVLEFEHPYILLSDPNSHFSSMVKETGEKNAALLFQVAKDAYFQSNLKENAR
ncbi:probable multidrug resistance-associated protein lethal(2)03659 [Ostrinia furnacalis]|uniref:probable multidrug resistance-associated protein lethal(2)03659 n=1 Tax=Ostrinia furnacalis TaxID=93504 RepID=UPI00103B698C|nr:probable multidrug resistance-associated protein lethal(2)03659 [Ostrinia furnacalis]